MWGHRRWAARRLDAERIEAALREAERRTSAELRVSVAPPFWGDVRRGAVRAFVRLGMADTRQRNGVLFFVVPARRRVVVLGDVGANACVEESFWQHVVERVTERFREKDFTGGLVQGIHLVGERLAENFPYQPEEDVNELPEAVDWCPPPGR